MADWLRAEFSRPFGTFMLSTPLPNAEALGYSHMPLRGNEHARTESA